PAENEANRAYRLLAETMERSGRAGIATFVMRDKEYLVALVSDKGVLRADTLRFHDELRGPSEAGLPLDAVPEPRAVERYKRVIAELAADEIDRAELVDTRTAKLRALIDGKLERGVDVERAAIPEEEQEEAEVIDLMEVLKRRLQPEEREPVPNRRGRSGKSRRDDELEGRSKAELYERAKALGVRGRSQMDKDELVRALRDGGGCRRAPRCRARGMRFASPDSKDGRGGRDETRTTEAGHDPGRRLSRLLQRAAAA